MKLRVETLVAAIEEVPAHIPNLFMGSDMATSQGMRQGRTIIHQQRKLDP